MELLLLQCICIEIHKIRNSQPQNLVRVHLSPISSAVQIVGCKFMQLTSIPQIRRSPTIAHHQLLLSAFAGLRRVHKIELISHIAKQLTIFRSPSAVPSARYGPLAIKMRKHKLSNTECESSRPPRLLGRMCLLLFGEGLAG